MRGNRRVVPASAMVCAGVLCWAVWAGGLDTGTALKAGQSEATSFFPVAVWYGGGKARAPMLERLDATSAERWGRDLDAIKSVGFNTIKCWVDWATAEPRPDEFHFENLDLLLRLAQARGLRVIVQVYLDSAPDWVGERFPGAQFVDRSGAVIKSHSAPGYCIDHAGAKAEIVKFLRALSRDANRSSALYAWDVWSEPHVINWAEFPYLTNPEFCYCASSQARFREWLKKKYKTLEALNAAWYRGFERWDQVEPPRSSTILSYTDYIDWRTFIDEKLAEDLKTRVDAIRTGQPGPTRLAVNRQLIQPITSHAAVPGLFTSPTDGYGEPDDWRMAASADFFGTSLYPKHSQSTRPWPDLQLAAALDFTRSSGLSLGKGFWIGELQAGQGATAIRIADPVTAHDLEYWMWQAVSHGAREIAVYAWYPMNAGYESNGYGLINLDGTLTDRSRAAGNIARIIAGHAAEINAAMPAPAEIAILYNRLSYMVGGEESSLAKLGNAERDSLLGLHRAFTERQIPVDFVSPRDVLDGKIARYKILFLPYAVMLSKDVADGVRRYVHDGGTAVAEARLAWNDERGFSSDVIPGFGLAEVFGAKEKIIRPVERPEILVDAAAGLPGLAPGEQFQGEAYEEDLQALGQSHVLAKFTNGEPAMVENSFGRGKAFLMGSFLALDCQRHPEGSTKNLLLSLARAAGATQEVKVSGAGTSEVEVRRLVNADYQLFFAFNHSDSPAHATVTVRLPWASTEARDLTNDQSVPAQTSEGVAEIHFDLNGGAMRALRLKGR